ncbi:hypothetical protein FF38_11099 [Lucilia cuprina]|uniref:Uncharacterized protein n=1 Tax=Lucilia cuprina TaxID=7375 RepID=A0A0L0C5D5_LUCCU|nr:hypothetical protein FF38_11099 [Lucilia cuprina]
MHNHTKHELKHVEPEECDVKEDFSVLTVFLTRHGEGVYNENIRTTSAVEAYNGVIGRSAEKNGHFL